MRRFFAILFSLSMAVSCGGGFSSAERERIMAGEGDVMQVMSIANRSDSLLLRSCSQPVSEQMASTEEFSTLCRRMLATVQSPQHDGVGIAAPQVGILREVIAVQRFDKQGAPFELFVNPKIRTFLGQKQSGGEGCLSVPDRRGDVERFRKIVLEYRDTEFRPHLDTIEGFTAVIFQHEVDHLRGRLYIDKEL